MKYYSTNKATQPVSFEEATLLGQPADKGLFYPTSIPNISFWMQKPLQEYDPIELAFAVMQPYTEGSINEEALYAILEDTLCFPFPLRALSPNIWVLELFHGPTLAFKDLGARFMSRCLHHFSRNSSERVTVLVATSGDTGGAVADGFKGIEGVDVIILYPSGRVSQVQELQLTTCEGNVVALEIAGNFDDCQRMVKQAFSDNDLQQRYRLTSANSINVARWLPQQLYYFFAMQQWPLEDPPILSVPSGNFGNLCAGMLAQQSGLRMGPFLAACNRNDAIPEFMRTGTMPQKEAVATLSNAMDVALPSNFSRIMEMYQHQVPDLRQAMQAFSVSDEETIAAMRRSLEQLQYLTDPHGAVGLHALEVYLDSHQGRSGIFLETAHPIKFSNAVGLVTNEEIPVPERIVHLFAKSKKSILLPPNFSILKDWMLSR